MSTDQTDAIRLIQNGLDKLGHSPGAIDGKWGVRTARALRQLICASFARKRAWVGLEKSGACGSAPLWA